MDTQPSRSFAYALDQLRQGSLVSRRGWNAAHYLGLQIPDENSANTLPYIYLTVGDDAAELKGKRVPWVASHTDLLANDWMIVGERADAE